MNVACGLGSSLAANSCHRRCKGQNASQESQLLAVQRAIISPRMLELMVLAQSAGYHLKDVPAGGDCMFSAFLLLCSSLECSKMHSSFDREQLSI